MRNWDYQPPGVSSITIGVLYYIVNNVPCVSTSMSQGAILQTCAGVHKDDPFCVVYLQDDLSRWYKGEYCYANQRYKFTPVGLPAVPDIIIMMQLVAP